MQIVENWSRVCGRVESWAPPRGDSPGVLCVHVRTVAPVRRPDGRSFANLLDEACDQRLTILVPPKATDSVRIRPGDEIEIDVRRGRTGVYAHPNGKQR